MSNYHNVSVALLVGLALGSSAIAETAGQSPAPAQFEEPSYSQTCEEESETHDMILFCLYDRRSTALELQYQKTWQVLDAWQSDSIVEAFEKSQSAWRTAMYNYCEAVAQLSRPKHGLYANEVSYFCMVQHQEERSKALKAIYSAATDSNFKPWLGR